MHPVSRRSALLALAALACFSPRLAATPSTDGAARKVLRSWYRLILELIRHTPTQSPPVASRSLAYLGVTAFEAMATGSRTLRSLAGQLNGLPQVPPRHPAGIYDDAAVLHAALSSAVEHIFSNTGPTGRRAMTLLAAGLRQNILPPLSADVAAQSLAHGKAVAAHILAWSAGDGGALIDNMGFPLHHPLGKGPAHWVPTSLIAQQQKPLLPFWGENRPFLMPTPASCALPPPPDYSEDSSSLFYRQAREVHEISHGLTSEQRAIARFWSDDAMLSPTPPGHWVSIALQIIERDDLPVEKSVEVLARLGIALGESFIACWHTKFRHDLLRPVTYIRRHIDPAWEPLLTTPPFPEYPSGHSTQSAAAAVVLTDFFGSEFTFSDSTHEADGLAPRRFPSFWAAAHEAALSRLYGGIHFRAAIEQGLEQGRCVGAFVTAIRTRR